MGFEGENRGMANALLNESFGASNGEVQQPNTQRNQKYQSNAYLSSSSPLVPPESEEGEYTINS